MDRLGEFPVRLAIFALSLILFLPFLGNVPLFDWDEINFAESAREMLVSGDYFRVKINYLPFWEKPPLFIWLQVLSFKLFGVNEYAARLPNAICGIITFQVLFSIGRRHFSEAFGVIWVMVYAGSFLPHFYFKSGIIDPCFNLFIFLGIYYLLSLSFDTEFINYKKARRLRMRHALLSGFFIGLAVLTKGPVALLLQVLAGVLYYIYTRGKKIFNRYEFTMWLIALIFTTSIWYGYEIYKHGMWFVNTFIDYQIRLFSTADAGHAGPFYYHFIVVLVGCFPASIFIFDAFRKYKGDAINQVIIKRWMIALLFVVLVLFSIVKTKILHYSSLAYFPVTFLATYTIYKIIREEISWRWYHLLPFILIGAVWGTAMMLVPIVGQNPEMIIPYIKDPFGVANLDAVVYWHKAEMAYGIGYMVLVLSTIYFFARNRPLSGISMTFLATVVIIQLTLTLFTPRIERYSQHAAIEYFKDISDEDCYVNVAGYKSYAHYFYGKKNDILAENERFQSWLVLNGLEYQELESPEIIKLERQWHLEGNVDKVVYIVTKINRAENLIADYGLEELDRKNGFVLLVRRIPN